MKILINRYEIKNFDLRRGDTFAPSFEFFEDECDEIPIDLTGWTRFFEIRDHFLGVVLAKNDFELLPAETATLHPTEYRYQMSLTSPTGERKTFFRGFFRIKYNTP